MGCVQEETFQNIQCIAQFLTRPRSCWVGSPEQQKLQWYLQRTLEPSAHGLHANLSSTGHSPGDSGRKTVTVSLGVCLVLTGIPMADDPCFLRASICARPPQMQCPHSSSAPVAPGPPSQPHHAAPTQGSVSSPPSQCLPQFPPISELSLTALVGQGNKYTGDRQEVTSKIRKATDRHVWDPGRPCLDGAFDQKQLPGR